MSDLDALLDSSDPTDALAEELVRADFAWVDQLVKLRKRLGLSQMDVAEAMGRSQSVVSDIETMSSDPRLSTLRRYALAIGAAVKHRVFSSKRDHLPSNIVVRTPEAGMGRVVAHHGFYVSASGKSGEVVVG